MSEENVQNTPEQKPEDIFAQRAAKVQDLAAAGILPFGRRFDNVQMTADVRKNFKPEAEKQEEVTIAGRMTAFRAMGKSIFADIKDSSGRMQIYVQRDQIGEDDFNPYAGSYIIRNGVKTEIPEAVARELDEVIRQAEKKQYEKERLALCPLRQYEKTMDNIQTKENEVERFESDIERLEREHKD